jgi:hypothetical protein
MESLPNEIKHEILLQLDYPSLLNVCQINVAFWQICRDDSLWRQLFQRHYPTRHHNDQISWRQNYVQCRHYDHLSTFVETFLERHLMLTPIVSLNGPKDPKVPKGPKIPKFPFHQQMIGQLIRLLNAFMQRHRLTQSRQFNSFDLYNLQTELLDVPLQSAGSSSSTDRKLTRLILQSNYRRFCHDLVTFLASCGYHQEDESEYTCANENESGGDMDSNSENSESDHSKASWSNSSNLSELEANEADEDDEN